LLSNTSQPINQAIPRTSWPTDQNPATAKAKLAHLGWRSFVLLANGAAARRSGPSLDVALIEFSTAVIASFPSTRRFPDHSSLFPQGV
jgi:hypothetical protein